MPVPSPTEGPFELRRMTGTDLDAVLRIERAAHAHPWSADLLRQELGHEWSTVLLVDDARTREIRGYIVFWLVHDEIHILNVATDPASRRRGLGRQLMLAAEESGVERGASLSTLEVRVSNDPAINLYRALGYRKVGVRPRYYADNHEDALIMLKELHRPG